MTDPAKTFDETVRAAFFAGMRFGVCYPGEQAIPSKEADIQYRAWRDSLAGNIWTPQMWLQARVDAGLVLLKGDLLTGSAFPGIQHPEDLPVRYYHG